MPRIFNDPGFDESYRVRTYTKESYTLNRAQATLLNQAIKANNKGRLEFRDFDIFVPNVSDFYYIEGSRHILPSHQIESAQETHMDHSSARARIAAMKAELLAKTKI